MALSQNWLPGGRPRKILAKFTNPRTPLAWICSNISAYVAQAPQAPGLVMNGKFKLILKLPKSLQQDSRPSDSGAAKAPKKRSHPGDEGNSNLAKHSSSQQQPHRGEEGSQGPAKKPKLVVLGPGGARPFGDAADGRPPGPAPIKQRLSIKCAARQLHTSRLILVA